MIKKCLICAKQFEAHHWNQKFCSENCARVQARVRVKANKQLYRKIGNVTGEMKRPDGSVCINCGKTFEQHFPNEKFCSDTCRLDFFSLSAVETLFDFVRG